MTYLMCDQQLERGLRQVQVLAVDDGITFFEIAGARSKDRCSEPDGVVTCTVTEEGVNDLTVVIVDNGVEVIVSVKFRIIGRR